MEQKIYDEYYKSTGQIGPSNAEGKSYVNFNQRIFAIAQQEALRNKILGVTLDGQLSEGSIKMVNDLASVVAEEVFMTPQERAESRVSRGVNEDFDYYNVMLDNLKADYEKYVIICDSYGVTPEPIFTSNASKKSK